MNKTKFISLATGLVLAMAFTLSCSSDDSPSPDVVSSSSAESSSSVSSSSLDPCAGLPSTQFCSGGEILSKCGGTVEYNPATEACCGSGKYTIATHYCHDGQAHTCGNLPHDPSTHYCYTDGKAYTCGNKPLNPDTQFCYEESKIGEYCGEREDVYNPDLYECKPSINPNGIYLKTPVSYEDEDYEAVLIGTQTWLARNLNYAASGSKCGNSSSSLSDDNTAFCDTYGRLYNWATVLDFCPEGWHLPSDAEWTALTDFVELDGDCSGCAGTKLKATSGWNSNGNGTDNYGFSALPGGSGIPSRSGYPNGSFYDSGREGYWWSATEFGTSAAYYRGMLYYIEHVDSGSHIASDLFSVRCVQN